MHIGILDDDTNYNTILMKKLSQYGEYTYKIYQTISNDIFEENFDIFFLDVMLENQESFQFGEKLLLMKSTILVYISSVNHFVYKSIRQDSFFFVRKSNIDEDLESFFNKYRKLQLERTEYLNFKANGCMQCVLQKNIIYIRSHKNIMTIHTLDKDYTFCQTLKSTYDSLNHTCFYKLNSYIIINLNYIEDIISKQIILNTQEAIPFSRNSKKNFLEAYALYKRKALCN